MKVKEFIKYVEKYPGYTIVSDSGWECNPTDINSAAISHESKLIILNQGFNIYTSEQLEINIKEKYNHNQIGWNNGVRIYGPSDFELLYNEEC